MGQPWAWMPFPLYSDVHDAASTAGFMGITAATFKAPYSFSEFGSVAELKDFVGGKLHNSPAAWSYRRGSSTNVDQYGNQPKGTDSARMAAVEKLKRIPPVLIVKRKNGDFSLVDGSHRLSYATDHETNVGVAVFDEQ